MTIEQTFCSTGMTQSSCDRLDRFIANPAPIGLTDMFEAININYQYTQEPIVFVITLSSKLPHQFRYYLLKGGLT